jgi:hypothetical protein
MSFFEKARQAADKAAEQAKMAAEKASEQAKIAAAQAGAQAKVAGERVRRSLTHERLAELIVKATALQERTNAELRSKQSPYRITEINVTASFPPNIGFVIARVTETEPEVTGPVVESTELLEQVGEAPVLEVEEAPAGEGVAG